LAQSAQCILWEVTILIFLKRRGKWRVLPVNKREIVNQNSRARLPGHRAGDGGKFHTLLPRGFIRGSDEHGPKEEHLHPQQCSLAPLI